VYCCCLCVCVVCLSLYVSVSSVVCGLWSVVCGLWSVVCGLWSVVCGLWSVVCGLWTVVCGLWTVVCGLSSVFFLCIHIPLIVSFISNSRAVHTLSSSAAFEVILFTNSSSSGTCKMALSSSSNSEVSSIFLSIFVTENFFTVESSRV
jgi:hypothetical protein